MQSKHAASAPYYMFYTTIKDAVETHNQENSITFKDILDPSLGELKCSLQITFLLDLEWLLAQYKSAGCSAQNITILYGDEKNSMPRWPPAHVDTLRVKTPTLYGTHHTKMMVLCYTDGSLRVVILTANLYGDDWNNRTQGLWISPRCPELPPDSEPSAGESPTQFKQSLREYLSHYNQACLSFYLERVKRCDFSKINVFLVASVPGSHPENDWGLTRAGALLLQHCRIPAEESPQWPVLAQASSIGSCGEEPGVGKLAKQWLTENFLQNFAKIINQPEMPPTRPELCLIYPSTDNVEQSHDGRKGGDCLSYKPANHEKQPWLCNYFYQWKATSTHRNQAMPHIKSYTRLSPDHKKAAFYLLTSANVSQAAWGSVNKGNGNLSVRSYEAGVLFLPKFVINKDFFPLKGTAKNRLILAYDVPPTKYTEKMSPWTSNY